ncbi:MAG: DUF4296 domain-containing protein [Flavobacteriales bacterium]|nr:DUF4296 domain-containing protein [Flavobacteriales bacterium]
MRIFSLVFVLWLITACKKNTDKLPQGILSADQMKAILVDIHLAKGARTQQLLPDEFMKNPDKVLFEITQAHHTDTITFQASYQYYVARPEQFQKIYKQVITAIETIP